MSRFLVRRLAELAVAFGCVVGMAGLAEAKKAPVNQIRAYVCARTGGSTNLTSGVLFIFQNQTTGEVTVLDELIFRIHAKEPIPAKVSKETEKRQELSWDVKGIPLSNSSQTGRALYHVTFFKDSLTYVESALLSGFDNAETSNGTCKSML